MMVNVSRRSVPFGEAESRGAQVLTADERLVASQLMWPGQRMPKPSRRRRPQVLRGLRMPGDRWEGAKSRAWGLLAVVDLPYAIFDRLFDCRPRKKGKPLSGGWNSLAGQFAAALHPRSRTTGVVQLVQVTDRRLRITYLQRGRRSNELGAAESGWSTDLHQVAWLRNRRDVGDDNYEIGFVDGSWARVRLAPPRQTSFIRSFPDPGRSR
ncbi:hypothetical protein [Streptomyces sp. NPDC048639]|uniref:hypothetical protein n=1 Tax=Streptomyces sp. NPDC048639 TaxID=3365581 RepID=UPI003715F499